MANGESQYYFRRRKMQKVMFATGMVAAVIAVPAFGAIEYDSLGFETSAGFQPGVGLEGQAGGSPTRQFLATNNSFASPDVQISEGVGVGGTNGVAFNQIDLAGSFDSTEIGVIVPAAGSEVPTAPVSVSTAINVQQFAGAPVFGFSSLGQAASAGAAQPIIFDVIIEPTAGEVFVNDATPLGFVPSPVAMVALDVYNEFEAVLDYDTTC